MFLLVGAPPGILVHPLTHEVGAHAPAGVVEFRAAQQREGHEPQLVPAVQRDPHQRVVEDGRRGGCIQEPAQHILGGLELAMVLQPAQRELARLRPLPPLALWRANSVASLGTPPGAYPRRRAPSGPEPRDVRDAASWSPGIFVLRQERLDLCEFLRLALAGRAEAIGGPARLGEHAGAVALCDVESSGEEEVDFRLKVLHALVRVAQGDTSIRAALAARATPGARRAIGRYGCMGPVVVRPGPAHSRSPGWAQYSRWPPGRGGGSSRDAEKDEFSRHGRRRPPPS